MLHDYLHASLWARALQRNQVRVQFRDAKPLGALTCLADNPVEAVERPKKEPLQLHRPLHRYTRVVFHWSQHTYLQVLLLTSKWRHLLVPKE